MRILFYSMNWYPFIGSIQPINAMILRHLRDAGHEITILTSIPYRMPGRAERWEEYRGKWFCQETWENIPVVRMRVLSPSFLQRFRILVRMLNMVSFLLSSLLVGLTLRKHDVIMTISHPPIAMGINSWLIALVKRCRHVYCLKDIYPDILVEARFIRRGFLYWVLRGLERFVYRRADRICVLSDSMKSNLVAKKIAPEKIEVIHDFADPEKIRPLPRDNELARRLGLHQVFVVLYPGSLSFRYGIEEVLAAAERLDHPSVRWIFIDRGQHRQEYRREIEERRIVSAHILPFQPADDYPLLLASCDLGLVTLERGFGAYSVPSKLFGIMAAGRGIVALVESDSEVAAIIRKADCGVVVESGDAPGLAAAVGRLAVDPERCQRMGQNARRFLEIEFPPETLCRRYHEVLQSCVESSSRSPLVFKP
ncbi:MAG: glycosyltransferase family 4 protein [Phycisphaerae bacterium]|nr:glycosyltransferase family 4 protein [Phycisphaerae bacterium]